MATLGVFVKEPLPGKVKTRLGKQIGEELSAQLYEAFLADFTETVNSLSKIESVFAYAPSTPNAQQYFQNLSNGNQALWQQPETDLGSRMGQFFKHYLTPGNPVVIVGSDSPTLPARLVEEAFELLKENDVVIGPAVDGGYYLVGQSKPVSEMFEGINWSEPNVLQQTIERLRETKSSVGLLTPWYDIDSLEDVMFLRGHLNALELSGTEVEQLLHTKKVLEIIFSQEAR